MRRICDRLRLLDTEALMEFLEAVRLVYNLANGMELTCSEATSPELKRQAESQSEALDLICEWLHAQGRE